MDILVEIDFFKRDLFKGRRRNPTFTPFVTYNGLSCITKGTSSSVGGLSIGALSMDSVGSH